MRSSSTILMALIGIAVCLTAGGCTTRTIAENSVVDTYGGVDEQLEFWDELSKRRVVTNNDALHGLIILAAQEDPAMNYEFRVHAAREWGWMPYRATSPDRNASATTGLISVAICEILNYDGGVTMSIFGPSGRYATRELVYQEILPMRSANQSMTGAQFIDLMGRVEDIMPVDEQPHRFQTTSIPPDDSDDDTSGDSGGKVANVVASVDPG